MPKVLLIRRFASQQKLQAISKLLPRTVPIVFTMNHAGEILILTGPPGSGKTTVSEILASELGSPKVHMPSDDFWHFIKNGAIPPYHLEAHEQNKTVIRVLSKCAANYALGGYFVIVDGIIGPWFLHSFRQRSTPVHYIILRPSLETSIKRCRNRVGNQIGTAAIAKLHAQFTDLRELELNVLTLTNETPEELSAILKTAVESDKFRLG